MYMQLLFFLSLAITAPLFFPLALMVCTSTNRQLFMSICAILLAVLNTYWFFKFAKKYLCEGQKLMVKDPITACQASSVVKKGKPDANKLNRRQPSRKAASFAPAVC